MASVKLPENPVSLVLPSAQDNEQILIKKLALSKASPRAVSKIEKEGQFASEPVTGFRRVLDYSNNGTTAELRLEYITGSTAAEYWKTLHTLEEQVRFCLQITERLAQIHRQQVLHLNLNPDHILVSDSGEIFMISLGLATYAERKLFAREKELRTDADADYIAPEQTGRIQSDVDYTTDLYALGITFYNFFTGVLPFADKTGMAKIHAHIALLPPDPDTRCNMPKVLSKVIMKMIQKDVSSRYHSADGVANDLRRILEDIQAERAPADFEIGSNDSSGMLRFSDKLFGRREQIDKLMAAFHESVAGHKTLLLVYGNSGTGKSALVEQIYRPTINEGGIFLSGKFDPLKTDVPYFAFSQAFEGLMDIVQLKSRSELEIWKERLHASLNPIGRVLYDVVPGLAKLLPDQPPLPEINGFEAQLRFNYAMNNFLAVLGELCELMVIFIDDLQWSDPFSLQLIKNILTNEEVKNVLLIGAYRDNEVTTGHHFLKMKMEIEEAGIVPEEIQVQNLTQSDIQEFVDATLGHSETPLGNLSEIVYKKSQGNALFATQFVRSAFNNGMLRFNPEIKGWEWNEEAILEYNVEGDIVNLLLQTVNKLDVKTIELLKKASCVGNKFPLEILVKISAGALDDIYRELKPAIVSGLVIESRDRTMYFVHDRVQQALYSLTDDSEKAGLHLEIGRLMLRNTPEEQLWDSIFEIVNQFNFAGDLVTDEAERRRCCELNTLAGNRSQRATAYASALQYYETALGFVGERGWETDYSFTYNLYLQAAIAANQCNERDQFEALIKLLDSKAAEGLDKIKVAHVKIQHAIASSDHKEVIRQGLEILNYLGVRIKAKPSQIDVLLGFIRTNMRLRKFSEERIAALPRFEDEKLISAMSIMHHVSLAAYWIEPNMVPLIMFKLIEFTLKNGLGPKSPFAFVVFGYINIAYMNRMKRGLVMGELGNRLSEKLHYEDQICSLKQVYNTFISHWLHPLRDNLPDLEDGFRKGLETGDFEFSSITGQLIIYWQMYGGETLDTVLKRGELLSLQVAPLNQAIHIERIKLFRQSALNIVEGVSDFNVLKGEIFDETAVDFPQIPAFDIFWHNLNAQKKLQAIVFNRDEEAWEFSCKERAYMIPVKGSPTEILFYFYETMAIAGVFEKQSSKSQKKLLKTFRKNIKLIENLLQYSEENYRHRYELMKAELARITGAHDKAMLYYSNAIRYARENRVVQDEALAWERAGQYFLAAKQPEVATFYFSNAYKAYHRWGARAKQEQMLRKYEGYIRVDEPRKDSLNLDLDTVLKTINLISAELSSQKLLTGLMNLVVENAGAQNAYLIVRENDQLYIRASVTNSGEKIEVLQDIAYEQFENLSHSVINHVIRTDEIVVLGEALQVRPYANDPYIIESAARSIACLPLIYGQTGFAYLYLENNLVGGAFTEERVEILKVMTRQTAISLQNTMLFEETNRLNENLRINKKQLEEYNLNLERKVAERTQDLEQEKQKSDQLLLNILPSDIARELKEKGKADAQTYESVSVLFTDFKDFSKMAENMTASELVSEIDHCFRQFDEIVHKHNIEKIKTIGDSYMAVAGLPVKNRTHPRDAVLAALEIRDFIVELKKERMHGNKPLFDMRIGIHTGNVVAGIVGSKKFAYDIWGDTVNIASRMESHGAIGKVNISQTTYELLKDEPDLIFEHRGKVEAKGKGELDMYFVDRKP